MNYKSLPFLLLGLCAAVIAVATFVENVQGTDFVHHYFYGSLWFKLLWAAVVVSGGWLIWRRKLWRRLSVFMLHVSLALILVGALVTSLWGRRGTLHLRQGVPAKEYYCNETRHSEPLPFFLRLDSFEIKYYAGTQAPRDYLSYVSVEGESQLISMNNILKREGYRFYQSSYDEDMQGSLLSVNHDPWGTGLTYLGYALLGLSMMWVLLSSGKRLLMVLLMAGGTLGAKALPAIPADKAAELEREQVMWNNRVAPFGTMAQEFLLKVYGRRTYHGLTPTQVMSSIALEPEQWSQQPIIKVGRGKYRPMAYYVDLSAQPPTLQHMGEDAKADEKVGLLLMLMHGSLVQPVPEGVPRLSESHVRAELLYHRIDWLLWGMMAAFTLALLAGLSRWAHNRKWTWAEGGERLCRMLCALLWTFLLVGWLLRWYVAGHLPLSNGFETMFFVAICLLSVAMLVRHLLPLAVLATAFVLLVAHLGEINPRITPLMPVLHSPWLSLHVSIIMMSYALLVLSIVERRLLRLAVFLLAAGIFLGAVWANVSWGTYWSWDPKESWALITLLVYSIPLHAESLPWFRSRRNYRIYSLLAFACLLMTYLGVNYLLGGMHSYN